VTENVANVYVKELDEHIAPYVLENTPPVLTVGYRCIDLGYSYVWPKDQTPYFIRLDGMIMILVIESFCII
jgi:hypothetical protein